MEVQWYPGHMTKARRMMEEDIRLVDLVVELVDARIPLSSSNPDIDALSEGKGRVVLLCKADLADPDRTEQFVKLFKERGILAMAADARERKTAEAVRRLIREACAGKIARDRSRGIVGRPLRAMVAGIPNVGKSTFINSFAGRTSAKTGNKPGVTRGKQWIRLGDGVELLDTPGILWPKFDSPKVGFKLALAGAVRDEILDKEELAVWLLQYLERDYPGLIREKYLLEEPSTLHAQQECREQMCEKSNIYKEGEDGGSDFYEGAVPEGFALLVRIARARRLLMKGAEPDTARAAAMLLDDCKNGRIGRISLDSPDEAGAMRERREEAAESRKKAAKAAPKGAAGKTAGKEKPGGSRGPKPGAAPKGAAGKTAGKEKPGGSRGPKPGGGPESRQKGKDAGGAGAAAGKRGGLRGSSDKRWGR